MEKLIEILKNIVSDDIEVEINENTDIIEELKFDSIDIVKLLNDIEGEFGIDFMDLNDFFERFIYVRDIWEGIEILLEEKNGKQE